MIVTPLIINAQRELLERIHSFGGPAVPQPHHVMTQKTSGKEVANLYTFFILPKHFKLQLHHEFAFQLTSNNYVGCQLVSGWTPLPERRTVATETKNTAPPETAALKGQN